MTNIKQKQGLDDLILYREHAGFKDVQDYFQRLYADSNTWLPTADGVDRFAAQRLRVDASNTEKIECVAALLSQSEIGATDALSQLCTNDKKRTALLNDARKYLKESTSRQKSRFKQVAKQTGYSYDKINKQLGSVGLGVDNGKLCFMTDDNAVPIANFVPIITREIERDDGQQRSLLYEVSAIHCDGIAMQPVIIPVREFGDTRWVEAAWGKDAIIYPRNKARDYICFAAKVLAKDAPKVVEPAYTGWTKDHVYVHAGGCIGGQGLRTYVDTLGSILSNYTLPDPIANAAELIPAIQASLQLLTIAPLNVIYPLMAACYAAPLRQLFIEAGCPVGFSLFLHGESGSMKSSLAAVVLNHVGQGFTHQRLTASFRDTANSIEKALFELKDSLGVVDDWHPAPSRREHERMATIATSTIRGVGNQAPRKRMKANLESHPGFPPRAMVIMIGEIAPHGVSDVARAPILRLVRGEIKKEAMEEAQSKTKLYAQAMSSFIAFIAVNYTTIVNSIREAYNATRKSFSEDNKAHLQTASHAALLYLSFQIFVYYAQEQGAIDDAEANGLLENHRQALKGIARDQEDHVANHDPLRMFANALDEMMTMGRVHFSDQKTDGIPPDPECLGWEKHGEQDWVFPDGSERCGWANEEYIFAPISELLTRVIRHLQEQHIFFPLAKNDFLAMAAEKGLIVKPGGTRTYNAGKVNILGKQLRMLRIRRSIFREYTN